MSELDSYLLESTPSKTHVVTSERPNYSLKSITHAFTYFLYTSRTFKKKKEKNASHIDISCKTILKLCQNKLNTNHKYNTGYRIPRAPTPTTTTTHYPPPHPTPPHPAPTQQAMKGTRLSPGVSMY